MNIGARQIGPGCDPYVIAEIGVNHDGEVDRALELVDAAAASGADAVKVQFFRTELLMSGASRLAAYQRQSGERDPHAMLRRLELPFESLAHIAFRAHQRGIHAVCTVFSLPLAGEANGISWDAFKTASPDVVHRPLLEALAMTGRPLIVSTGAATLHEIERAAGWLRRSAVVFLQCVSAYPAEEGSAAIAAMHEIARATGRPVGYSDHTARVETAAVAVGAGACILEKHLTHSRSAAGPDHAASLEPAQFAEYVRLARLAHRMLGDGRKRVLDAERDVRETSRQSVIAARFIPRGRLLDARDLTVKRPGTGLPPFLLEDIRGRVAMKDIAEDTPVREEDLA